MTSHQELRGCCPSPQNPCFCDCHLEGDGTKECLDCLCGRHKTGHNPGKGEWNKKGAQPHAQNKMAEIINKLEDPQPIEEWEKRFRSILDNYMPNENIRNLLMSEIKSVLSSDRERVRAMIIEEHHKLEEWYASAERPDSLTHFEANQRNIATRNAITRRLLTTPQQ